MTNLELKGFKGLRNLQQLVGEGGGTESVATGQLIQLDIAKLIPGKYQPRKQIGEKALQELAESIKTQGIIQPLVVRNIAAGQFEIIAGERRWRAAQIAKLTRVPVIIKDIDDNTALAFALIENIQREDLNPIEEAEAFARFHSEFSMTHAEIAEMVGKSRTAVTNTMRLLNLIAPVREYVKDRKIEMGHARALLSLEPEQQLSAAQHIIAKNLNVRQAEKLVQSLKLADEKSIESSDHQFTLKYQRWCEQLTERLSSKVSVKLNNDGAGKIMIHVDSADEVDWLVEHLKVV